MTTKTLCSSDLVKLRVLIKAAVKEALTEMLNEQTTVTGATHFSQDLMSDWLEGLREASRKGFASGQPKQAINAYLKNGR